MNTTKGSFRFLDTVGHLQCDLYYIVEWLENDQWNVSTFNVSDVNKFIAFFHEKNKLNQKPRAWSKTITTKYSQVEILAKDESDD